MEEARLELPATPAAAGVARLFLRCLCQEWGAATAVGDTAELLCSELVTNAVVHAKTSVELYASFEAGCLHVDVHDRAAREPRPRAVRPGEDEGGRGLTIVASLASSWGVQTPDGDGKTVWFELSAR